MVESTEDPAYRAVSMLTSELKVQFAIIAFNHPKSKIPVTYAIILLGCVNCFFWILPVADVETNCLTRFCYRMRLMLRLSWLVFQQPAVRRFTTNWYVSRVQAKVLNYKLMHCALTKL